MALSVDHEFSNDPVVSRVLVDVQVPATWSSPGAAPSIHKSDEHALAATETNLTGLRSFEEFSKNSLPYARSPSPPAKLSSAKQIFEKYCADETWPECELPISTSTETDEETMLPSVYAMHSSETLADTHPNVRQSHESLTVRSRLWHDSKLPENHKEYTNNESTTSNHPKGPSDITRTFHVQVDPKRSPLSSTLHNTHVPSALNNKSFQDHSQVICDTLKCPSESQSPRNHQNHLLNYGPTEDDTDSSLASSLRSESDIGEPNDFMEVNTLIMDQQANLLSQHEPSISSEHRSSKAQGRAQRLSKLPDFHRLQVQGTSGRKSLLHQKLVQSGVEQNQDPLGRYALWGSTNPDHGIKVRLYFPGQVDPATGQDIIPLSLQVRTDASMENLVGFGLLSFFRTYGRYPLHPETTASSVSQLTTDAWNLRIVEDGCVDDDYPTIDPNLSVGQFGEDEFAVCPELRSHFQSTLPLSIKNPDTVSLSETGAEIHESLIALDIMVVPAAVGLVQVTISSKVSAAHVLEQVCQLYQLGSPNLYLLLHRDMDNIIPPHQLVNDFSHTKELILVERKSLRRQVSLRQHDNGPLPEQPKYQNAMDLISSYKASIIRSLFRHIQSTVATILLWVDTTVSLHWMANGRPAEKRISHAKSTSYHKSSILVCEQNIKVPNQFRLVAYREKTRDTKRYEFEAEDRDRAREIVFEINQLCRG